MSLGLNPDSVGNKSLHDLVALRAERLSLDLDSYRKLAAVSSQERSILFSSLVVTETWLFRDWPSLKEAALQTQAKRGRALRVLSLPCSTGEEPYSIACALWERGLAPSRFEISAIDINEKALRQAERGLFRQESIRGFHQPAYLKRHPEGLAPLSSLYERVSFFQEDALDPQSLKRHGSFDLILCRNLLIYLDKAARLKLFRQLHQSLCDDGLLLLSHSEAPTCPRQLFELSQGPKVPLFRKSTVRSKTSTPEPVSSPSREPSISLKTARRQADKGEFKQARESLRTVFLQDGPSDEAYFLRGLIASADNAFQNARRSYHSALALNPEHQGALFQLSLLLEREGKTEEANRFRGRLKP